MPTVYFAQRTDGDIKIGWTNNLDKRMYALRFEYGPMKLLGTIEGGRAVEQAMHERFAEFRRPGNYNKKWKRHCFSEWFSPAPPLMWFVEFGTEPPAQIMYDVPLDKRRLPVKPPCRKGARSRVQELLQDRLGDLSNVSPSHLAREADIGVMAAWSGLVGLNHYLLLRTAEKWANYFDVTFDELVEIVPDEEAPPA